MKLILLGMLVALFTGTNSFKLQEREESTPSPAEFSNFCKHYNEFLMRMAEYEHQHEHDDDDHDDDDHDDDDHDDGDEDRDEDDHDEDDHDEEEGHCSGPMGMVHCIIVDFGGDDECIDKTEFVKAWEEVGMKTQPETQFFEMIEMMGGCI